MCVATPPTFAPSPLRDAWGLHPPSQVGTRNRPALLRTRQAGTRAPSALLRAAGLPGANHGDDPLQGEAAMGSPPAGYPTARLGVARRLGAVSGLGLCGRISDTLY